MNRWLTQHNDFLALDSLGVREKRQFDDHGCCELFYIDEISRNVL